MTKKHLKKLTAFEQIQRECEASLADVCGVILDDITMKQAQSMVDCVFRARQRQRKFVVLDDSGIQLTAVKLRFSVNMGTPVPATADRAGIVVPGTRQASIGVDHWCTAFYPCDPQRISTRYPNSVALGFANGIPLFINNNELCAERVIGRGLERYSLDNPVPPESTSVLFVAYLRARSLGHIKDSN